MNLMEWLSRYDYLQVLLIFSASFGALWSLKIFFLHRLQFLASKTHPKWDDALIGVLANLNWPFFGAAAWWLTVELSPLKNRTDLKILMNLTYFILAVYALYIIQRLVGIWFEYSRERYKKQPEKTIDPSSFRLFSLLIQALVWLVGLVTVFQNLGFNVTALIGGISVTGIAIAFALQNIFADLFASLSIYFDKPFATGDYIQIGDDYGRVKHIGLKTTRVRTSGGDELVVSNKELTTARVHNFKHLKTRDFVLNYVLEKTTSSDKIAKLSGILAKKFKDSKDMVFLESGLIEPAGNGFKYEIKLQEVAPRERDNRVIKNQANLMILEALTSASIKLAFS